MQMEANDVYDFAFHLAAKKQYGNGSIAGSDGTQDTYGPNWEELLLRCSSGRI